MPQLNGKPTMSVNYGSKRTVVGAHYGLRDWLSQRVTAALMALFTVVLLVQVLFSKGPIGYDKWAGIFRQPMDEGADLLRDRGAALARLGRHARHLDGLRQARGPASGAAGFHHRLAGRLRRLGHPGSVAPVSRATEG
jgi:hypothetical protein